MRFCKKFYICWFSVFNLVFVVFYQQLKTTFNNKSVFVKCSSADNLSGNLRYLNLENNETAIALNYICIFNNTIELLIKHNNCWASIDKMIYGFTIKLKTIQPKYVFLKNHVVLFIDAYPVIENLHHFIKDFSATLFSILKKANLLGNVTNRYILT